VPARPIWKGHLKLSLVAVPVAAYSVGISDSEVHFNQLHKDCGSRIKYKKTCPIHGEVPNEDIVSGYEHAKGQYVVVDPEEVDKLRTPDEKTINLSVFIKPQDLDPIYLAGSTYYVLTEGTVGQRAFAVLHEAVKESGLVGLAQVVFHGREQLVLVRPAGRVLALTTLHLDAEINKPAAFEEMAGDVKPPAEEVQMARTVIRSSSGKELNYAQYRDRYTDRMKELIEAKIAGKEVVAPPALEQAPVVSLMEALKRSVAQAAEGDGKPAKKMAESAGKKPKAKKKQA
jgi:DNA end-binding protein Ku